MQLQFVKPLAPPPPPAPKLKLREFFKELQADQKLMVAELKMVCFNIHRDLEYKLEQVKQVDKVAAVREKIEILVAQKELQRLGENLKTKFEEVFLEIPHLDELPMDIFCCIKLKDTLKTFQTQSYSTPRKHRDAWATLIQQHLDAG